MGRDPTELGRKLAKMEEAQSVFQGLKEVRPRRHRNLQGPEGGPEVPVEPLEVQGSGEGQ